MKLRMTETTIQKIKATGTRVIYSDSTNRVPGFQLIAGSTGSKTFYIRYRKDGQMIQERIGEYGCYGMDLAAARDAANQIVRTARGFGQPASFQPFSTAPEPKTGPTVNEVFQQYIRESESTKSKATMNQINSVFSRHILPAIGNKDIREVSKSDIRILVNRIVSDGHEQQAVVVLKRTRALMNFAIAEDLLQKDPTAGLKRPAPMSTRDRVIDDTELAVIWAACNEQDDDTGLGVQLLILTGLRKSNVFSAEFAWVNFEDRILTVPASVTKSRVEYTVPLSSQSMAIIERLRDAAAPGQRFLFPNPTDASKPMTSMTRAFDRIMRRAGVTGVVPHDARRSFASSLEAAGCSLDLIDRCLHHSKAGVTGRHYAKYAHVQEMREVIENHNRRVLRIASGLKSVNAR